MMFPSVNLRRSLPRLLTSWTILLASSTVVSQSTGSPAPVIKLTQQFNGYNFNKPVGILDPNDGTNLLYVVEKGGKIQTVSRTTGDVGSVPFLNVSSRLGACIGYCDERGLLGLVFHPDYETNGYFYINYTRQTGSALFGDLSTYVSRFTRSATEPTVADADSELVVMTFDQPSSNHNAGDLAFGPDGYLYITTGDGGSAGDPFDNGQNTASRLGKLLRIDVDQSSGGLNFAIPPTNPFVSTIGANPEIWAYGLRNPWRISFDSLNGNLFIADVGQYLWEEVNLQPANSAGGENYGWNIMEGFNCFSPSSGCNTTGLTMPIFEYDHQDGKCSITGGHIYRGEESERAGNYYYADYCSGQMWAAKQKNNGNWASYLVHETDRAWSSFGKDANGDHYAIDLDGDIFKIETCQDDPEFYYADRPSVTCEFIRSKRRIIERACEVIEVQQGCPQLCRSTTC